MTPLSLSDFAPRVDTPFAVRGVAPEVTLTLADAGALAGSARPGGAFRLEFHGPVAPALEQATYALETDGEAFEIFIVPIGQDADKRVYEAIFF